jgi:ABC-type transporter Mla maintaining outer membrane lipid asymmetry permease subunit MlaE
MAITPDSFLRSPRLMALLMVCCSILSLGLLFWLMTGLESSDDDLGVRAGKVEIDAEMCDLH